MSSKSFGFDWKLVQVAAGVPFTAQVTVRNAGPGCQFLIRLPLARPAAPAVTRTVAGTAHGRPAGSGQHRTISAN